MKYGPICTTGDVKKILLQLQKEGSLGIMRNPDATINGTPTKFMSENNKQTVSVRWQK
jgi:hypothetical protein